MIKELKNDLDTVVMHAASIGIFHLWSYIFKEIGIVTGLHLNSVSNILSCLHNLTFVRIFCNPVIDSRIVSQKMIVEKY